MKRIIAVFLAMMMLTAMITGCSQPVETEPSPEPEPTQTQRF